MNDDEQQIDSIQEDAQALGLWKNENSVSQDETPVDNSAENLPPQTQAFMGIPSEPKYNESYDE